MPGGRAETYTVPNGVTSLGDYAFDQCAGLTSVTIPSTVTTVGWWAFLDCGRLSSIYFQGNAPSLGTGAFASDTATVYYSAWTTGWAQERLESNT